MELICKIGVCAGSLCNDDVIQIDVILNRAGRTDTDDILYTISVKQLVRVDANGRHTHSGGHHRYTNPFVVAGISLNTPDVIHQYSVIQKVFSYEFGAQGITWH